MPQTDLAYFKSLKQEIAHTLTESHSVSTPDIAAWKGSDILTFQVDLEERVNGRISEKWFYTHIKSDHDRLPRIDVLNMLSKYAGFEGWAEYIEQQKFRVVEEASSPASMPQSEPPRRIPPKNLWIGLAVLGFAIAAFGFWFFGQTQTYRFCFIDADRLSPIASSPIRITLINEGESPIHLDCDENGCFEWESAKEKIRFVVESPYYRSDTITRYFKNKVKEEQVRLNANDYALMIHYFSTSKVEDWKKRREQMDRMFADNALIYQIKSEGNIGMELFNKQEFINKMTMPVKSLRNVEVIETIYSGGQISILKFRQEE